MCEHHEAKPRIFDPRSMHRRDLVRGLWTGGIVLGVASLPGCADVAGYFAPSDDQLAQMSAEAWAQTKAETPISRDSRANSRLLSVGQKISRVANVPNAQWEFVVFDSPEKNAWVLPGGKVGFYKGLMDFCDNDDQVSAVLGHEVGHVTARHAALRAGEQQATSLGLALGEAFLGNAGGRLSKDQAGAIMAVAGAGAQYGILLPFSRQNESEADRIGVDYMHAAGYDVRQSITLWQKMGSASASRPPEFMSTHPDPTNRAQSLKDYINAKGYAKI